MGDGENEEKAPSSREVKLKHPIQFGEDMVETLTIKPTARAFRDFGLPMQQDGTIIFQPYPLAGVGIRMAGRPNALLDRMHPEDMWEVAQVALGFIVPGRGIGT